MRQIKSWVENLRNAARDKLEMLPQEQLQLEQGKAQAYREILKAQGGACAICKKINVSKKRRFPVDHRHSDDKRRGILCYGCNRAISILDGHHLFERAIEYLKAWQ